MGCRKGETLLRVVANLRPGINSWAGFWTSLKPVRGFGGHLGFCTTHEIYLLANVCSLTNPCQVGVVG